MAESEWRSRYLKTDPFFGKVAPSLLHSDDIHRYASIGCLISDYDEERLLPAGYRLRFLGDLTYWEVKKKGSLKPVRKKVKEGMEIVLPRNSIAYLHMQEEFRMPQYIAARFNLRITHVHQGLLLGTGPLVDPGFEGRIMVPLHNLTDNDYSLMGGDSFIHVEFTKLNELKRWKEGIEPEDYNDNYKAFNDKKIRMTPEQYFDQSQVRAKGGVVSNLKSALADAEKLNKRTRRTLNFIQGFRLFAAIAFIYGGYNLVQSTNKVLQGVHETASKAEATVVEVRSLIDADSKNSGVSNGGPVGRQGQAVGDVAVTPVSIEAGQQSDPGEDAVPAPEPDDRTSD